MSASSRRLFAIATAPGSTRNDGAICDKVTVSIIECCCLNVLTEPFLSVAVSRQAATHRPLD